MSCQFLHKLAPELRERIYQYALDFCDTPLRNVGLLQPFVKNFTGAQGGLRLGYEDPMGGDSVITRVAFDEPLFDSPSIDTAILCTCKRIYREAIKVFYDLNTISVSVEVFNLIGINTPLGTELSLAKSLAITIRCESSFNTLDLDIFFPQIQSMSPNLKSVHIYTDGTSLPCTSLFDIGQDLSTSPYVQTVRFVSVGHLIATSTATPGLEIHVKYKILSDQWQAFDNMSQEALSAHAAKVFARPDNASTDHIYHLYGRWRSMDLSFVQELVEWEGERFWTDMPRVCPAFAQGGLWSWELWTWLAVPYRRRDQAFDFGEAAE